MKPRLRKNKQEWVCYNINKNPFLETEGKGTTMKEAYTNWRCRFTFIINQIKQNA